MERCPNCGNKLSNIDVLCPKCGTVVEVIQIKSTISLASENEKQSKSDSESKVKKDFPESFIVYNEDFPSEEPENKDSAVIDTKADDAWQAVPAMPADVIDTEQLEYAATRGSEETTVSEQPEHHENTIEKYIKDNSASDRDEENDYSSRYLEHLKDINLPEIDEIQSFDPEEFMREYKRGKDEQAEMPVEAAPVSKQWLEIEETFETEDTASADAGAQSNEASDDIFPAERRYRASEIKSKTKEKAAPVKRAKQKKYNVGITVLLWLVISAAFFCCFMFFDNYVKKAYGGYDSFIYTISDGKIDIEPGN